MLCGEQKRSSAIHWYARGSGAAQTQARTCGQVVEVEGTAVAIVVVLVEAGGNRSRVTND